MSILNVLFEDEDQTAFVGVDSEVRQIGKGEFHDSNKLFVIPCASTVLACRGEQTLVRWVTSELLRITGGQDFDAMASQLPAIVSRCHAEMVKHSAPGFNVQASDAQLVMVGYSAKEQRVICSHAYRERRKRPFEVRRLDGGVASPDPEVQMTPNPDPYTKQFELAQQQVKTWKAKQFDAVIGGRLVVAKVTKDEVTTRNLGAL